MAETVAVVGTDNVFGLDAKFHTSESVNTPTLDQHVVLDGSGDYGCSTEYNLGTAYRQVAEYCSGGSPDIVSDLGTILSEFGNVETAGIITSIEIAFEAGLPAKVTLEGHQHASNEHIVDTMPTFDISGIIPASSGVGVPTLITVGSGEPVAATVRASFNHIDKVGADGAHAVSASITCKVELSVTYEGHPSSVTAGDWLNIILEKSKSNEDTPTATLTAEQYIDVVAPTP